MYSKVMKIAGIAVLILLPMLSLLILSCTEEGNNLDFLVAYLFEKTCFCFAAPVNYPAGDGPHSVFSIDFNGDGYNDLATANVSSGNVSILLGNGDGTFQSAVNYAAGDGPYSVFSIDFNGDGNNDLATANYNSDNVSILINKGH